MNPLIAGLMSGASSLVSGMFSSDASAKQLANQQQMQLQSEQFNAAEAEKNRQFQLQMSNSAFQRAASDMKQAGLNPILAAGAQESSPGGASASIGTPSAPSVQSPFAGVGEAVSKAVNTAISAKTLDKMTEEIANIKANTLSTEARTRLTGQETQTEQEETMRRMYEKRKAQLDIPVRAWSARRAASLEGLPQWAVDAAERGGYAADAGGKVADLAGSFVSSALGVKRLMPKRSTMERTDSRTGDQTFEERWSNH